MDTHNAYSHPTSRTEDACDEISNFRRTNMKSCDKIQVCRIVKTDATKKIFVA